MNGTWEKCVKCRSEMWLPQALCEAAQAAKGRISFYCAYGHGQVYAEGESEAGKLRRERDRLAQQVAQRDDEIRQERAAKLAAERQLTAARKRVTTLQRRASAGVCPCCSRSFSALKAHMSAKHPEFVAAEIGAHNVVKLKRTAS